jgi:peroxiredoxin
LPSTIEQVHREFGGQGLVVLAINLGEEREHVAAWARSRNVTSTILLDSTGAVMESYRVAYTPTVFLVDRSSKLVGRAIGNKSWLSEKGRALFRALLAP